ncbi:hypothetical protein NC651_035821 [Populus alba x Populus x berolinensis]|nr:hypothetical protein NC651_035821 [Populus alba x Populus x berolinensis]
MQEENGEGESGSCFRCRHGGSAAGIGSGASKRSCSYGRAQIMINNEISDLECQRVSFEERKRNMKKNEKDELRAQRMLSMYASVTNIIPDLDDHSKISGRGGLLLLNESTWGVPCARTMPGKLKAIEGNRDRRRLVTDIKERCIINYHPWHVFVRRSEMICFFGILEDKLHVYLLETSVLAFKLRMHYASLYKLNDRKKCLKKPRTIAIKYLSESRFYQIRPEVDGTSMYDVQIAFIFPMLQNTKNSISPWNQSEIENGHEISLQDLSQGTCNETAAIRTKRFII